MRPALIAIPAIHREDGSGMADPGTTRSAEIPNIAQLFAGDPCAASTQRLVVALSRPVVAPRGPPLRGAPVAASPLGPVPVQTLLVPGAEPVRSSEIGLRSVPLHNPDVVVEVVTSVPLAR